MFSILQFVAVLSTTLFTGAACYIALAEPAAGRGCETEAAATEWLQSRRRAMRLQNTLAAFGGLTGILAWLMGDGRGEPQLVLRAGYP